MVESAKIIAGAAARLALSGGSPTHLSSDPSNDQHCTLAIHSLNAKTTVSDGIMIRNWMRASKRLDRRLVEHAQLSDEINLLRQVVQKRSDQRQVVERALMELHDENVLRQDGPSEMYKDENRMLNVSSRQLQEYRAQLSKKAKAYRSRVAKSAGAIESFNIEKLSHTALALRSKNLKERLEYKQTLAARLKEYHGLNPQVDEAILQVQTSKERLASLDASFQSLIGRIQV